MQYDATEFDGTLILSAQSPTAKRLPSVTSATGKNLPPIQKDFMCSIWLVNCQIGRKISDEKMSVEYLSKLRIVISREIQAEFQKVS